jgi:hypothetical protein
VTSSPVVTHYVLSPEESLGSTIAGDLWMQDISERLFGVKLELDYAESDGADGFISGAIIAWKNLKSVLNCTFHVIKLIGSGGKSTLKKKFLSEEHKITALAQARKLQYCKSQEQFDSCMKLLCDEWVELGETDAANYLKIEHGTYPHNKWWYCAAGKQEEEVQFHSTNITLFLTDIASCMASMASTLLPHRSNTRNIPNREYCREPSKD